MALRHYRPELTAPPLLPRGRLPQLSANQATTSRARFALRSPISPHVKFAILTHNSVIPKETFGEWKEDASAEIAKRQGYQWAMTVSYDGTRFSGWQIQPEAITVQGTILGVLSQVTRCNQDELSLTAASRTDAGVHAWGQVVSFTTPFIFDSLEPFHRSLNSMLPPDIRIREVKAVHPEFNARFNPMNKTYQYKAYNAPVMDPCKQWYALHLPHEMNVDAMQEAASLLVGMHNFAAFANSSSKALLSPAREIYKFTVQSSGPNLSLEVQGKSFLYKQVRNMVGLLLEIGKGNLSSTSVSDVLASHSRERLARLSSTAPARGLYLMSVNYDGALYLDEPKASYGRLR